MHQRLQQWTWMVCAVALASHAWAQTNPDLPALPPDMSATPPAALPPPLPAPEPVAAPALPAALDQPPVVMMEAPAAPEHAPGQVPAAQAAPTATELFEPPATDLPAVPAAASEPSAPAAVEPAGELKANFKPSYGDFATSLLFGADDIDRMKKILYMYESVKRSSGPAKTTSDIVTLIEEPISSIQEPAVYPSFHLSSIIYRSGGDWLVWINGEKFTTKNPPKLAEVVGISNRSVTFAWKPEYIDIVKARYDRNIIDMSIPKHYKSRMSQVRYDEAQHRFLFTLSPNQTFVGAAMGVYEGKFSARTVPQMVQEEQMDAIFDQDNTPAPQGLAPDADAKLKSTLQNMQKFNNNIGQFAPKGPSAPNTAPANPDDGGFKIEVAPPAPQRAM